jgi:hypothetical protein
MASRKNITRRESDHRREAETVLDLRKRAEEVAAKLLKQSQAGTITRMELKTGLKEIEKRLKRMHILINKIL